MVTKRAGDFDLLEPELIDRDSRLISILHFLQAHYRAQIALEDKDDPVGNYLKELIDPVIGAYRDGNRGVAEDLTRQAVDEIIWRPIRGDVSNHIIQRALLPMCYLAQVGLRDSEIELKDLYGAPIFTANLPGFLIRVAIWLLLLKPKTLKDCKNIFLGQLQTEEREVVLQYVELRNPSLRESIAGWVKWGRDY